MIERLNEHQRKRGPDSSGVWSASDGRVTFAHRRLAIIDTSSAGLQPMTDATGRWQVVFNGEIYNYHAVRADLERAGHVFLTNSDTEVLINAVAQWGEAGLSKLRGMYAFALWDGVEKELWLVRDPYGIKPLYYAIDRGTIWFASQARALAECAPVDTGRDAAGLTGFFLWGHVPEPFTWWAGIQALPAGHSLRVRSGQNDLVSKAHFQIEDALLADNPRPLQSGELRELLLDSVRYHLVSDVPVGVFLSAGVDSAVIAALATELGANLQTVTLAFDEYKGTTSDEAPLAERVAMALDTRHRTVRIGRDAFESLLEDFFGAMDLPSIDGLNTFMVSQVAAAQGLKVALSGLGGDELFGGYPSFTQVPRLVELSRRLPVSPFIGRAGQSICSLIPGLSPKAAGLFVRPMNIPRAYFLRRALHLESEIEALLDPTWIAEGLQRLDTTSALSRTIDYLEKSGASLRAQISALEACWYMRNQLLRDTDWASMAHGLEVRVPFVDAALLTRIGPAIASIRPPTKRALAGCTALLPSTLANRRKTGFTTPVQHWISDRTGVQSRGLRGWANDVHRHFRQVARSTVQCQTDTAAA